MENIALSNDWLNGELTTATIATTAMNTTPGSPTMTNYQDGLTSYKTNWYYPYPYTNYVTTTARPIRLSMSEVEALRKAAKADEKLKAILQKFTAQIEVIVDFK